MIKSDIQKLEAENKELKERVQSMEDEIKNIHFTLQRLCSQNSIEFHSKDCGVSSAENYLVHENGEDFFSTTDIKIL